MTAAHPRDDAKAARVIAAFGDFHVSEMTRRESKTRCGKVRDETRAPIDFHQWTRRGARRAERGRCGRQRLLKNGAGTASSPRFVSHTPFNGDEPSPPRPAHL